MGTRVRLSGSLASQPLRPCCFDNDSIPAIFAITRDPFLVFTSNIFALLGLRSLYFLGKTWLLEDLSVSQYQGRYLGIIENAARRGMQIRMAPGVEIQVRRFRAAAGCGS